MKFTLLFALAALFLFTTGLGSTIRDALQCGKRQVYQSCPPTCPDICSYGTHKNRTCTPISICIPRCACMSAYVLDPVSNECWTNTYCTFKKKISFIKDILGISNKSTNK